VAISRGAMGVAGVLCPGPFGREALAPQCSQRLVCLVVTKSSQQTRGAHPISWRPRILQSCCAAGAKLYRGLLSLRRYRVPNRIMGSRGTERVPQMLVLKTAASCWRRAAEAETQAAQISDRHLKAAYLRIADQWSVLARSYEFADSAERFLLDAKRTKDADAQQSSSADAQQPSGELVLLPVVAREWGSSAPAAGLWGRRPSAGGDSSTPTGRQRASEQGEPRQAQGQSSESLGHVLINRIRFTPNRTSPTLS
jgi:hypothetical protein